MANLYTNREELVRNAAIVVLIDLYTRGNQKPVHFSRIVSDWRVEKLGCDSQVIRRLLLDSNTPYVMSSCSNQFFAWRNGPEDERRLREHEANMEVIATSHRMVQIAQKIHEMAKEFKSVQPATLHQELDSPKDLTPEEIFALVAMTAHRSKEICQEAGLPEEDDTLASWQVESS